MEDEERPAEKLDGGEEGDAASEMRKIMNYPLVKVLFLFLFYISIFKKLLIFHNFNSFYIIIKNIYSFFIKM